MTRFLVLSPHPDDETLGCGGTLRRHVMDGDQVSVVFLTSGEKGGHEKKSETEVRDEREAEARKAAAILGIKALEFWREPDGMLEVRSDLIERLHQTLQTQKPDFIYVPHLVEMHKDHAAAAHLIRETLKSKELGFKKPIVRMFEIWTPLQKVSWLSDISGTIEVKMNAARAYQSQLNAIRLDDAILSLNRYRGEMHSWPGGPYAEAFEVMV